MILQNAWAARLALLFVLCQLSPRVLGAQQQVNIQKTLEFDVFLAQGWPTVTSYANAVLYSWSTGGRIYDMQLILGHQVFDYNRDAVRWQARFVSDIGYASTRTGALDGDYDHCYDASMAAHVNATNQHEGITTFIKCMPSIPEPPPKPEVPEENCPILLDLKQNGFHLSGPDPAVSFDIDADGIPDLIAWTKAGEDDAFLCLDRNGNGVIDDGRELFGYATQLLSGAPAEVGYRALGDLDRSELGGNGDGKVDADDGGFSDLCAWVDANRDGISQPGEIHALAEAGVVALDYDNRTTGIRDSYGNLFRYASSAMMRAPSGVVRPWRTYDVIFAEP